MVRISRQIYDVRSPVERRFQCVVCLVDQRRRLLRIRLLRLYSTADSWRCTSIMVGVEMVTIFVRWNFKHQSLRRTLLLDSNPSICWLITFIYL